MAKYTDEQIRKFAEDAIRKNRVTDPMMFADIVTTNREKYNAYCAEVSASVDKERDEALKAKACLEISDDGKYGVTVTWKGFGRRKDFRSGVDKIMDVKRVVEAIGWDALLDLYKTENDGGVVHPFVQK